MIGDDSSERFGGGQMCQMTFVIPLAFSELDYLLWMPIGGSFQRRKRLQNPQDMRNGEAQTFKLSETFWRWAMGFVGNGRKMSNQDHSRRRWQEGHQGVEHCPRSEGPILTRVPRASFRSLLDFIPSACAAHFFEMH
jgi:hypothetical protein